MDLNLDELYNYRNSLEKRYSELEDEIYSSKNKYLIESKEKEEEIIEEQLNLLDQIIHNLIDTPKLYRRFIKLNKEYGDNNE